MIRLYTSMNKAQNKENKTFAPCPECDTPIPLKEPLEIGSVVECPSCAIESEILSHSPLTLSPLEEEK